MYSIDAFYVSCNNNLKYFKCNILSMPYVYFSRILPSNALRIFRTSDTTILQRVIVSNYYRSVKLSEKIKIRLRVRSEK